MTWMYDKYDGCSYDEPKYSHEIGAGYVPGTVEVPISERENAAKAEREARWAAEKAAAEAAEAKQKEEAAIEYEAAVMAVNEKIERLRREVLELSADERAAIWRRNIEDRWGEISLGLAWGSASDGEYRFTPDYSGVELKQENGEWGEPYDLGKYLADMRQEIKK